VLFIFGRFILAPNSQALGMSAHFGANITLPKPVLGYHPGTFLERGAAVPFITPQLNGARARPGSRGGLEFTVPNPSGGRGVYIVPWEGLFTLSRPTVHDCRLISLLSAQRVVTPGSIREAARAIAAEGLAGRAARAAAEVAIVADAKSRMVANFQLLLELVGQVEAEEDKPLSRASPADLELRARRVVALIAPILGRTSEQVAAILEEISGLFAPIGLRPKDVAGSVGRTLAGLAALRDEMVEWARQHPDESGADAARVAESADVTLICARSVLADVQSLPSNMEALLAAWIADPATVAARIARPEWLLDGWERIILLWQTAERLGRAVTLAEMASLIPVLPKEAADWARIQVPSTSDAPRRRLVAMMEDWRTGLTMHDLIARNEHLCAFSF
jgi:hypothetical protein